MLLCPTCRKLIYRTDACKGVGVECGRTDGGSKKSTAALKEVPNVEADTFPAGHTHPQVVRQDPGGRDAAIAGTQAPSVDTPKRPTSSSGSERRASNAEVAGSSPALATKPPRKGDRHRPGYMAEYLRKRRAAKKAAKT